MLPDIKTEALDEYNDVHHQHQLHHLNSFTCKPVIRSSLLSAQPHRAKMNFFAFMLAAVAVSANSLPEANLEAEPATVDTRQAHSCCYPL